MGYMGSITAPPPFELRVVLDNDEEMSLFWKTEKTLRGFQLLDPVERLRSAVGHVLVRRAVTYQKSADVDVHANELDPDIEEPSATSFNSISSVRTDPAHDDLVLCSYWSDAGREYQCDGRLREQQGISSYRKINSDKS